MEREAKVEGQRVQPVYIPKYIATIYNLTILNSCSGNS